MKFQHKPHSLTSKRRSASRILVAATLLTTVSTSGIIAASNTAYAAPANAQSLDPVAGGDGQPGSTVPDLYGSSESVLKDAAELGSLTGATGSSIPLDPAKFYENVSVTDSDEPGKILKQRPGIFAFLLPQFDLSQGKTTTIAYASKNTKGEVIPVTGTVTESTVPWKGNGPRPTLVIATGTQGNSDQCAPSRLQTNGISYESLSAGIALSRGYNVALTDLPGLGIPNMQHTYMNRVDQGQATLDIARAAINLNLPTINSDSPIATWGYSQGGGASASALELAPTYAPELNIKAGYVGGVPADLRITPEHLDGGALTGVLGLTVNSFLAAYPEVEDRYREQLNEDGLKFLEQTANECVTDTIIRHAFVETRDLSNNGKTLTEILAEEPFAALLRENLIGTMPPKVPVYVGHSTQDDTIPVAGARAMAKKWCDGGTPVYYGEQNLPKIAPGADHALPMFTLLLPAMNWLDTVFNGDSYATTECTDIPSP